MDRGGIQAASEPGPAIESYVAPHPTTLGPTSNVAERTFPDTKKPASIRAVRILDVNGDILRTSAPIPNEPLVVEIDYVVREETSDLYVVFSMVNAFDEDVVWQYDAETDVFNNRPPGEYRAQISLPDRMLRAGSYGVNIALVQLGHPAIDYHIRPIVLELSDNRSLLATKNVKWPSNLSMPLPWKTKTF